MNKRTLLVALSVLQCYVVLQASITDGVIFQIDGAKKANVQYDGYDLWIWDGNTETLNVSIYTNFRENSYYSENSWYGGSSIAYNYPDLYCNNIFTGSRGWNVNQTGTFQHNGLNYSYLYCLTIDSTKLNQTYNKVHLQVTHGYQAGTTSSQPIYIAKRICQIDVNSNYGSVTGSGLYNYGTLVTLTATNNDCYTFQKWSDGNTDNPRTVTVTSDSTFTAIFVQYYSCTIINNTPDGQVRFSTKVAKDVESTLSATSTECSKFLQWSDGVKEPNRTVIISSDTTFTAEFEKLYYTTIINATDTIRGEVVYEQ